MQKRVRQNCLKEALDSYDRADIVSVLKTNIYFFMIKGTKTPNLLFMCKYKDIRKTHLLQISRDHQNHFAINLHVVCYISKWKFCNKASVRKHTPFFISLDSF